MKNKIDWGTVILAFLGIFMDVFFIWFNTSFALEYFFKGNFNISAIYVVGTIVWTMLLYRDGKEFRKDNEAGEFKKKDHVTIEIIDKDEKSR